MEESSKVNTLVKNTGWIYINKVVFAILQFVVTILVIRKLEVEIYGTFNFLIGSFFIFQIFAASQVTAVFDRYIPELIKNKDFLRYRRLLVLGALLALVSLTILLVALQFFHEPFGKAFNIVNFSDYLLPFTIYIFARFSKFVTEALIKALLLHKQFSIINMVVMALRSFAYIYFLPVLSVDIMLVIESAVAVLMSVLAIIVTIKFNSKLRYDPLLVTGETIHRKRVIKFSFYSLFNEFGANVVGESSDIFIIAYFGNPFLLGLYTFGFKIYHLLFQILPLKDFYSILRPLFFQKFTSEHTKEEFIQMFNFIIKFMLPLLAVPAIYFYVYGQSIISFVYDPKYLDAYLVTCIILTNYIFTALFFPVGLTIQLKERMDIALLGKIVAVFSLIAGALGMKYFGIEGVALATILGSLMKNIIMIYFMRGKAHMHYRLLEYKNYVLIFAFLYFVFSFTQPLVSNLWLLLCFSALFMITAGLLVIMFHPYNSDDLQILSRVGSNSKIGKKLVPIVHKIHNLKPKLG